MCTCPRFTDEYLDTIFSRSASDRLADPKRGDDIREVISETAVFLHMLAHESEYRVTEEEYRAMAAAARVLWNLFDGKRPAAMDSMAVSAA